MIAGLSRNVADHAEGKRQVHVEHVFARHEGADQREGDDHRRHVDRREKGHPGHISGQRQDGEDHD